MTKARPWATLGSLLLHGVVLGLLTWAGHFMAPPPVTEIPLDFVVLAPAPAAPAAPSPPVAEPPPSVTEPVAIANPPPPPPARRREKPPPPQKPMVSGTPEAPPAAPQMGQVPPPSENVPPPVEAPPPPPTAVTSDFANLVFERIAHIARRAYPEVAQLRRQQGKVVYHLVISADGELLEHGIEPSGVDSLDRAAERAILAAAPFPKPPDLKARAYRLSGAIVYRLEN